VQNVGRPEQVEVPRSLPDAPEVRGDLLDYYFEVQRFDRDLGRLVEALDRAGELDRTIVIVTSDNGMPFPRAKANVYDGGVRVPLIVRWKGVAGAGAVVEGFASLTDLAPTILEGAGLKPAEAMTGRSLLPLLRGQAQRGRDRVFLERERHADVRQGHLSYPVRAIRTREFLYVRNYRPGRWPAGDPELVFAVGPFGDIDGGPTKALLLDRRADPAIAPFFSLATAKRPAEELYDLRKDPAQIDNVAGRAEYRDDQRRLRLNWTPGYVRPAIRGRMSTTTAGIGFRTTESERSSRGLPDVERDGALDVLVEQPVGTARLARTGVAPLKTPREPAGAGSSTRAVIPGGTASVRLNPVPAVHAIRTGPRGVGTVPSACASAPGCGRILARRQPGRAAARPARTAEADWRRRPHAWFQSWLGLYFWSHASQVIVVPLSAMCRQLRSVGP